MTTLLPFFYTMLPALKAADLSNAKMSCGSHDTPMSNGCIAVCIVAGVAAMFVLLGTWVDFQARKITGDGLRRHLKRKDAGYFRLSDGGIENAEEENKVADLVQVPVDTSQYHKLGSRQNSISSNSTAPGQTDISSGIASAAPLLYRDPATEKLAEPPCMSRVL